jgi:hypothetical protein
MAEQPDPKVSRRYRELGDEEPPRELDQAILAAAHRAADRPHAPLIAPAGRHRWYFAFGAAAIMVLAVAITVQLDRQQLDPEALPAASAPAVSERKETFADSKGEVSSKAEASSATPQAQEKARTNVQKQTVPSKPRSGPARDAAPLQEKPQAAEVARADRLEAQRQQPPAEMQNVPPAAPATPARTLGAAPAAGQAASSPEARARPQPKAGVVASIAPPLGPEQLLERIAELRQQGKHEEADKALAEFRQRYPEYRISDEMLKKVERPK